jgi:molybdenum-dependent DNA-binding transcriptional regulator ModE
LHLTAQAKAIIKRFEKLEKDVEAIIHMADKDFNKLFRKGLKQ